MCCPQGRTAHLGILELPKGPGSVKGPMRGPCQLAHNILMRLECGQGHGGPMISYCPGAPWVVSPP
ncbi:unnamed protein product, partial [Staurois parvus]